MNRYTISLIATGDSMDPDILAAAFDLEPFKIWRSGHLVRDGLEARNPGSGVKWCFQADSDSQLSVILDEIGNGFPSNIVTESLDVDPSLSFVLQCAVFGSCEIPLVIPESVTRWLRETGIPLELSVMG